MKTESDLFYAAIPSDAQGFCVEITIRDNLTSKVETIREGSCPSVCGIEYHYTEGNFGCDCNRSMAFGLDEPCNVGDNRFVIVGVVLVA